MSPNWFLNMSSPVLEVPITQFFFSVLIGKHYLISNGNRTEWGPIWSVIIRVINKIGRPRSGSPICLITTKFVIYRALFKSKHKKFQDFFASNEKKSHLSARVMVRTVQLLRHDAYCPIKLSY